MREILDIALCVANIKLYFRFANIYKMCIITLLLRCHLSATFHDVNSTFYANYYLIINLNYLFRETERLATKIDLIINLFIKCQNDSVNYRKRTLFHTPNEAFFYAIWRFVFPRLSVLTLISSLEVNVDLTLKKLKLIN